MYETHRVFEGKGIEAFDLMSEMSTLHRSDSFSSAHTKCSPAPYDFGRKSPLDGLYGSQNKCLLWIEVVGPATNYDPADNASNAGFYQRCVIAVPPKAKEPVSHADVHELSTLDRSGSLFALASFHSPSQKHRYLVVVEGVGSLEVYRK